MIARYRQHAAEQVERFERMKSEIHEDVVVDLVTSIVYQFLETWGLIDTLNSHLIDLDNETEEIRRLLEHVLVTSVESNEHDFVLQLLFHTLHQVGWEAVASMVDGEIGEMHDTLIKLAGIKVPVARIETTEPGPDDPSPFPR
jgi:hypothetical protein